ncbi:MAG: glycosyltransferase family 4 protein [Acidobacteria bacterium]|nr:glycosyltransferase family 4 protein [Acidobacteriota bacterium]
MAQTLFARMHGGLLYTLGDATLPAYQKEGNIEIVRFVKPEANFLQRTLAYSRLLRSLLDEQSAALRLCHFRDPWSGVPILAKKPSACVYEINGLPSIELPFSYPRVAPETLKKIRAAEIFCWTTAAAVITPSQTMKDNLVRLGVDAEKIAVITNGADINTRPERPPEAPPRYLIYFGALQRWQGVEVLLKAFARLKDFADLHLVICSSTPHRFVKEYGKLAARLEIAERLIWHFALSEAELAPWRAHALLSVAPLTECARNLEQGCCPLKILESMAAGVAVVASDIPAVREIISDGVDGKLIRADRPADLARAIRVLLEYPDTLQRMGERAKERIAKDFRWQQASEKLSALYAALDR